jgi:hypothetical protein
MRIIFIITLIVLFNNHGLYSQDLKVRHVDLQLKNKSIFVRVHVADLFDTNTQEYIASGMSQNFNLQFQLYREGQSLIRSRPETVTLRYDVWEQIYLVQAGGKSNQFTDFDTFQIFVTDSMEFSLGNIRGISPQIKLNLFVTISRQELSERQHSELRSWIAEETEAEESQPALETDQSFSINISKLLSIFFSRQASTDLYIYKSAVFTLNSLSQNEDPTQ